MITIVIAALTAASTRCWRSTRTTPGTATSSRRQARRREQVVESEVPGVALPRDRRPRPRRPAAGAGRRHAPRPRRLAAQRLPPAAALGDRLVLADRRLPGGPPARLQRGHARLPLVGEGARRGDRHQPPARRRRARAAPLRRARAAARRRRQPRQHPLRRRAALDADDEHGAAPPAADRARLRRLLRPALRGRPHARRWRSPTSAASAARRAARSATTSARGSPAARSYAARPRLGDRRPARPPGRRPWSATSSPAGPSSTRPSSPTTRSPTTPGSNATTPSPCCATSTARSPGSPSPARDAPRPYRLVVLSDHGQSQGETFRDRYGETLEDLVRAACDAGEHDRRRRGRATTRSPTSAPA